MLLPSQSIASASQGVLADRPGSIRGVVYDKDFDVPLAAAQVTTVETGKRVLTSDQGSFVFPEVPPGRYTLIFSKEGYVRQVKADVLVIAGQLTDVDASLTGEFTDLEEFVVEDIPQVANGSEAALLNLRFESPALMDSIGSELMSRAGASDAAGALRLVAGASVQDGKYAVVRGLPDRYVSSQLNGVRLPTADEDKRAVQLDQYPAAVIESIQVSKTFMPDQQGDASGGAVDVRLKSIPEETILQVKAQVSQNTQVANRSDFLSYAGGGVNTWGIDDGGRDIQWDHLNGNWDGAAGTSTTDAPTDYKWSITAGGKHDLGDGIKIGGLASFFYERDSEFYDNGQENSYWVTHPGDPLTPQTFQGSPSEGEFKTALYDVTQGQQSVQWGGLGTLGLESANHSVGLTYLYTRTAEDTATLAQDTRGKEYFFPGYDPHDPTGPGNHPGERFAAPYIRTETLNYTERATGSLQLHGKHRFPSEFGFAGIFKFKDPELDWTASRSFADLNEPDKRQFSALWLPRSFNPGVPGLIPPFTTPPTWLPYKPAANFNLGNFQRIWKEVDEVDKQLSLNLKLPFEQWNGNKGYWKFGLFEDQLNRSFNQDTFSNFGDSGSFFHGGFDNPWSGHFPDENHPISESLFDVDYDGEQRISALYGMVDLPLSSSFNLLGGVRRESTELSIVNHAEENATWIPPGSSAPVGLEPGDADVSIQQDDLLPALGFTFEATKGVVLRGSYSQTVARQTFKELTPILQQEFAGGPVFIGNPELQMSALKNYDVRLDCTPYEGGLISGSWFKKDVQDPIEYVQKPGDFTFTRPVNYPKGQLDGVELELRQDLGHVAHALSGLSFGANATFIDSQVTLPDEEIFDFKLPGVAVPLHTRDMTGAPDHLYNLFLTYDIADVGTQISLFYSVQGDTLVAGAGAATGNFVPNIYAKEYDTLNLSVFQRLGKYFKIGFQAKNLTNPTIEEVYRSEFTGGDVTRSSYTKGIEYSFGIGAEFSF